MGTSAWDSRRGSRSSLPKKIRVHELAKELGLTNKEALDLCEMLGIGVKTHSSSIEDAQADRVRRKADQLGMRREVEPEEPPKKAPAAKTAAKTEPAGETELPPAPAPEDPAAAKAPEAPATAPAPEPAPPRLVRSTPTPRPAPAVA